MIFYHLQPDVQAVEFVENGVRARGARAFEWQVEGDTRSWRAKQRSCSSIFTQGVPSASPSKPFSGSRTLTAVVADLPVRDRALTHPRRRLQTRRPPHHAPVQSRIHSPVRHILGQAVAVALMR